MKEKMASDLKKYEAEIVAVNKRLAEIDEQRANLITHGRRIEGVVAYIKEAMASAAETPSEEGAA